MRPWMLFGVLLNKLTIEINATLRDYAYIWQNADGKYALTLDGGGHNNLWAHACFDVLIAAVAKDTMPKANAGVTSLYRAELLICLPFGA